MGEAQMWTVLVLAILVFVVLLFIKIAVPGKSTFCTACGNEGPSKQGIKGNLLVEIVLWCLFIVPGLIYSIWRHTTAGQVCARCGSANLVPPDSPMARKIRADLNTVLK